MPTPDVAGSLYLEPVERACNDLAITWTQTIRGGSEAKMDTQRGHLLMVGSAVIVATRQLVDFGPLIFQAYALGHNQSYVEV